MGLATVPTRKKMMRYNLSYCQHCGGVVGYSHYENNLVDAPQSQSIHYKCSDCGSQYASRRLGFAQSQNEEGDLMCIKTLDRHLEESSNTETKQFSDRLFTLGKWASTTKHGGSLRAMWWNAIATMSEEERKDLERFGDWTLTPFIRGVSENLEDQAFRYDI